MLYELRTLRYHRPSRPKRYLEEAAGANGAFVFRSSEFNGHRECWYLPSSLGVEDTTADPDYAGLRSLYLVIQGLECLPLEDPKGTAKSELMNAVEDLSNRARETGAGFEVELLVGLSQVALGKPVEDAFQSQEAGIRAGAIVATQLRGWKVAVPRYLSLLTLALADRDSRVRGRAISVLAACHATEAEVQREVLNTLAHFMESETDFGTLHEAWLLHHALCGRLGIVEGPFRASSLLSHTNPPLRGVGALEVLQEDSDVLIEWFHRETDPEIRKLGALSLRELGCLGDDRATVELCISLARDTNLHMDLQWRVMEVLVSCLPDADVLEALAGLANDDRPNIRRVLRDRVWCRFLPISSDDPIVTVPDLWQACRSFTAWWFENRTKIRWDDKLGRYVK